MRGFTSHTAGATDLLAALREHVRPGDSPTGKWYAPLFLAVVAVTIIGVAVHAMWTS